jgi:cell division protein YceG involved in septum cleavage
LARHDRSQLARERTEQERAREREARELRRAGRSEPPPGEIPAATPTSSDAPETSVPPAPVSAESPLPNAAETPVPPPLVAAETQPSAPAAEIPLAPMAEQIPLPPPLRGGGSRPPGGGPEISPRHGRRRSLPARGAALIALGAAIVVALALVHSLRGSSPPKAVAPAPVVKVVVPEGKTRLQIAQIAAAAGLTGSYRADSRHSALLDPAHYGAPPGTDVLEGFLFPATYDMDPGANVSRLVDEQLLAFQERFGASEISSARRLHVTPYQLLIVASMVEREALIAHDRPLIAAVIYNRLRQGMPLGIDATIYYAVELETGIATYTHELTTAQLHIESPYNTRTHTGLPPTPISNPGMASIEAAAHPARVPYLYYVAGADGCGEQVFSTTFAQFERNAAAYQAAVAGNGGHPPTCKSK